MGKWDLHRKSDSSASGRSFRRAFSHKKAITRDGFLFKVMAECRGHVLNFLRSPGARDKGYLQYLMMQDECGIADHQYQDGHGVEFQAPYRRRVTLLPPSEGPEIVEQEIGEDAALDGHGPAILATPLSIASRRRSSPKGLSR